MREHDYWGYMMTNSSRTVLYTGIPNDLRRRVLEYHEGKTKGFTEQYHVNRLVYFERFDDVHQAIDFEKRIKGWKRNRKNALVDSMNPRWEDLAVTLLDFNPPPSHKWIERTRK